MKKLILELYNLIKEFENINIKKEITSELYASTELSFSCSSLENSLKLSKRGSALSYVTKGNYDPLKHLNYKEQLSLLSIQNKEFFLGYRIVFISKIFIDDDNYFQLYCFSSDTSLKEEELIIKEEIQKTIDYLKTMK